MRLHQGSAAGYRRGAEGQHPQPAEHRRHRHRNLRLPAHALRARGPYIFSGVGTGSPQARHRRHSAHRPLISRGDEGRRANRPARARRTDAPAAARDAAEAGILAARARRRLRDDLRPARQGRGDRSVALATAHRPARRLGRQGRDLAPHRLGRDRLFRRPRRGDRQGVGHGRHTRTLLLAQILGRRNRVPRTQRPDVQLQ